MAGRRTSRRHAKIRKRKKEKTGKRKATVVRMEAGVREAVERLVYEPVKVTRKDYKDVEGFCKICGAKIYGDISLVNHASSHDSGLTISGHLSMSEDDRLQTVSELASKYLTAREPGWYRSISNSPAYCYH